MSNLMHTLGTLFDLFLVVTGFSLIIIIHELGHFLAARWAGVRVLAFAIGFGPALFSWRKGLGFRRGSSEPEYNRLVAAGRAEGISPTEWRANSIFFFGGYVKMLGQDDANPGAVSTAPDSYTSAPVAKRMVIISAGVIMNILAAAVLFVIVFLAGLRTEPPRIGDILPGSPAAAATTPGVAEPGLRAGDTVLSIDGRKPNSFNDIVLASAMAAPGRPLEIVVQRPGVAEPLPFKITPREDRFSRMLHIGVGPAASDRLEEPRSPAARDAFRRTLDILDLSSLEPGMRLAAVNGAPVSSADALTLAARASDGQPISLTFAADDGREVSLTLPPRPEFQVAEFLKDADVITHVPHLLGIAAPMRVERTEEPAANAGLKPGDVFARIGEVEWPTVTEGMAEIRAHAGRTVPIVVRRPNPNAPTGFSVVDLGEVPVSRQGTIGFIVAVDPADSPAIIATWPDLPTVTPPDGSGEHAAVLQHLLPGSRIVAVAAAGGDQAAIPVRTFADLRAAFRRITADAAARGQGASVTLTAENPPMLVHDPNRASEMRPGDGRTYEVILPLSSQTIATLHELGWQSPVPTGLFQREQFLLKASNPLQAVKMGLQETRRVMLSTYVTFARLFQGTVKIEHLRGPVGIAHAGTLIADRGLIWLLFFLGLLSVNLAVVNFLPLPIADGGHMVYLTYEAITGRPVSPAVQNAAALAGLVLIVGMFLLVTFNDVSRLFNP